MKKARNKLVLLSVLLGVCALADPCPGLGDDPVDIDSILGRKGQLQEGSTIYRFPRGDIKVTIDGEPMPTALGFGGWTAWTPMGKDAMVMGPPSSPAA